MPWIASQFDMVKKEWRAFLPDKINYHQNQESNNHNGQYEPNDQANGSGGRRIFFFRNSRFEKKQKLVN